MSRPVDETIIKLCQERDNDAFDIMVEGYGKSLYHFIFSLVRDHTFTDDLLQETLLKAYLKIDKIKHDSSLENWLRKIAYNLYLDNMKSEKRRGKRELRIVNHRNMGMKGFPDEVEHEVLKREQSEEVQSAVASLPDKQRIAISLFVWAEISIAEIANYMGCSEGTVMSHLDRARKSIKNHMKKRLEEVERKI